VRALWRRGYDAGIAQALTTPAEGGGGGIEGALLLLNKRSRLKVLCSYYVTALSKFALLRYLSEIRFQVLTAIYPRFTHKFGTIRKKQAIDGRN